MEKRNNTEIKKEVTVISTTDINYEDFHEDFKAFCEVNGYTLRGEGDEMEGLYLGGKITFYDYVNRNISDDIDSFWEDLKAVKNSSYNDYYVVTGRLGLWYGTRGGICETFDNLYDACRKCATDALDIVVKCDGKKIDFTCYHHDGTNVFEIRRLTWDDYDKVRYWDDDIDGNVFDYIDKHARLITYEMLGL